MPAAGSDIELTWMCHTSLAWLREFLKEPVVSMSRFGLPVSSRLSFSLSAGVLLTAVAALTACGGSDDPTFKLLVLNVAHINDHHSQLDAFAATELTLDGVATQVDLGGFARQTAMFKSVAGTKNLLKIHAGDAVTGTLYYTFFKGAVDA